MELHEIKEHLSDGLVIIVGPGLSCSAGIPGMGGLATQLLSDVPMRIDGDDVPI